MATEAAGDGDSCQTIPQDEAAGPTTDEQGADAASSRAEALRHHDLTEKSSKFWDPQMLIIVLKWLKSQKRYSDEEINSALVKALSATFLVQEWQQFDKERPAENIARHKQESERFSNLESHLKPFVRCMTELRAEYKKEPSTFADRRTYKEWSAWYQKRLLDNGEITPGTQIVLHEDSGKKLLEYCRMYYLTGHVDKSAKWLSFFIEYICEFTVEGFNLPRKHAAYWGLLASLILSLPHTPLAACSGAVDIHYSHSTTLSDSVAGAALVTVEGEVPATTPEQEDAASQLATLIVKLDELLEDQAASDVMPTLLSDSAAVTDPNGARGTASAGATSRCATALQHNKQKKDELLIRRTWLLHWTVWPLFRYYLPRLLVGGRGCFPRHAVWSELLDWFVRDRNLGTVQLVAPHLLRYFAVLAILTRSREDHFQLVCQAVSAASQSKKYSDPFTSLLEALFIDFDFDRAQQTLAECSAAAEADFFLAPLQSAIEESARLIIFETYCRIHKSINIDMIAKKLNMTSSTAERWIVNLIRHAKLDAKIDSERNRVEITTEPPNIYQQVVEKTRNVGMCSHLLIRNLEKPGGPDRGDVDHRRRGGGFGYRIGGGGGGFGKGGGRGRN